MQARLFRLLFLLSLCFGLSLLPGTTSGQNGSPSVSERKPKLKQDPPLSPEQEAAFQQIRTKAIHAPDLPEAEKILINGVTKARHLSSGRWEAIYQGILAQMYTLHYQYSKALDCYNQALPIFQGLGWTHYVAVTLHDRGMIHYDLGEYHPAQADFQQALSLFIKYNDTANIALGLNSLGLVNHALGDFPKAQSNCRRSYESAVVSKNQACMADSLSNLGIIFDSMGDYEQALHYHQQALELRSALGSANDIASSLNGLGNVYDDLGQFEEARQRLQDALKRASEPITLGYIYNNLGNVYASLGQFDKALDCTSQALVLREKVGNPFDIAITRDNLGVIYAQLGQFDKARAAYDSAYQILKACGDPKALAAHFNSTGNLFVHRGDYARAQMDFKKSLSLRESLGNKTEIAICLQNLGVIASYKRQYDRALDYFNRSLQIYRALDQRQGIAYLLENIGVIYYYKFQFHKAEIADTEALTLYQRLENRRDMSDIWNDLGILYYGENYLDKAEQAFKKAIDYSEKIIDQIGLPSQLGSFQDTRPNLYAYYADLLVHRHRSFEALVLAERKRGRGLAKQAAQNQAALIQQIAPQDAAEQQRCLTEISLADNQLRMLSNRGVPASTAEQQRQTKQREKAVQRKAAAESQWDLFQDRLLANYPVFRKIQGGKPPMTADLQNLARIHPDTLYLEWMFVENRWTLLFALSREGLKCARLPLSNQTLAKEIAQWRASLDEPRLDRLQAMTNMERRTAQRLYRRLLAPVEAMGLLQKGRYRRLVLVPEGPLLELPFAALMDHNGKRLVERYALASTISLGVLTWPKNPLQPSGTMLCAADPIGAKEPGVPARRRGGLGSLPSARLEGKAVVGLFRGALELLGPNAREAKIKQQMGRYAILHFATHGLLEPNNGLHSRLVLASEPANSAEDGFLEAREIMGMRLAARLAVLSACETARGQQSGGEGLLGLAWAFQAAGCPSVVASQWSIDDTATERLMIAFYKGIKAHKPKDEALQQAMLQVKREPGHESPYFWAAFQVIGDTQPLF